MKLVSFAVSSALLSMSNGEATCHECQAEDEQALLQIHAPVSGATKSKPHKAALATVLLQTTQDITQKVNSGQDPTECSTALNTVHEALTAALPNIYSQHQHHQNIIDLAVQNVEQCASREVDGVAMVTQQGIDLQTVRSNHASCRQREDGREGEEYCHQFTNLRNTHGPEMCFNLPEDEESIAWVNAAEAARDAAQTAYDEGRRLQEECQNFRETHAATQNECTQGQSQFELDYCAHRASCADLEICRAHADENYMAVTAEVESAMEDVVAEFLVLKHVECLLEQANAALATSSTVSSDECNTAASTDELIIDYPSVAAIDTCESTILTRPPCKSAFFDAEYASFGHREAMEEACVECSALPLAGAPTAWIRRHGLSHIDLDNLQCAQGSPSGCTATQVQLNGEYSPGPLVRVDNGNTVYRSTDADSCPPGFKIYSPRTQEDWRTIEASINFGEFNSPHHIVDVTRPADGCGGCTGNAMNSDNQAQSSWVTSDGSPWFLRAQAYGEPNGDYTTNCYLHLWAPHNGEVHFNDGSCSYHSNRYLCQVRTDYEPEPAAPQRNTQGVPRDGLVAWYSMEGFDANSATWSDESGNGHHATVSSGQLNLVEEESGPALHGTTSTRVDFGQVIPPTFTVASVTRYRPGSHGRILQGSGANWLHGHWGNNNCIAYYSGWKTSHSAGSNEEWQVMIGQNSGPNGGIMMCNGNRVEQHGHSGSGNVGLHIHGGNHAGEVSDFGIREVITWNRALSEDEILAVNDYLR